MDANREITRWACAALAPPADIPAHRWAEQNVVIDGRAGSFDGDFSTANIGYVRDVIDAIADNTVESVTLMCSVQSLKSTVGHVALARSVAVDAGPSMWVSQSRDEAKIMLRDRMLPLFRRTQPTAALLPSDRFAITNWQIDFASMPLYMAWGGSEKKLQSKPVRWLFIDEPEQYPDAVKEAEDRTTAFWNSRTVYTGTPKLYDSILDREFRKGHQAFWMFPCMKCGHWQYVHWGKVWYRQREEMPGMRWEKPEDDPWYECERCNHRHLDQPKTRHHIACCGRWEMHNPAALTLTGRRKKLSFTWNAIMPPNPPGLPWAKLKDEFIEATRYAENGNMVLLQDFVNKRLAEPFDPRQYEKRWIPEPVLYEPKTKWEHEHRRYMAVDVQQDRLYYVARAVAQDGASRLIAEGVLVRDYGQVEAKRQELAIPTNCVVVDAGWDTVEVYKACGRYGWFPIRAENKDNFKETTEQEKRLVTWLFGDIPDEMLAAAGLRRVGDKAYQGNASNFFRLIVFAADGAMDVLDNLMKSPDRWSYPAGVSDEYQKHIGAARKVHKHDNKGRRVVEWHYHKDDHMLSCERMLVVCFVAGGQLKIEPKKEETK